jgi:hypothetical protein
MVDPWSLVAQVLYDRKESEQNDGSSGSYEAPSDPCPLKGSDLLVHMTRITYQKKRYMSIRN